jgi:hypothetical protein
MELSIAPNIYLLELGEEGFRLLGKKKKKIQEPSRSLVA